MFKTVFDPEDNLPTSKLLLREPESLSEDFEAIMKSNNFIDIAPPGYDWGK